MQLEVKSEVNKDNMEIHIQELGWRQWVEKKSPQTVIGLIDYCLWGITVSAEM